MVNQLGDPHKNNHLTEYKAAYNVKTYHDFFNMHAEEFLASIIVVSVNGVLSKVLNIRDWEITLPRELKGQGENKISY